MGSETQQHDGLKERRGAILDRWKELALSVYPERGASFLSEERDRFQNPVGHTLERSLGVLYDGLLDPGPAAEMRQALDGIVRVRAVQDLSASEAVGFVFLLKQAVRDVLPGKHGLSGFHDRIDRLALEAFDQFVACREKIYELRMREVRNRTSALERLMGGGTEQPDGPPR